MRPVANFTLHAILAAAIAALATASAAAGGPAILTLGTETTGGSPQATKGDKPRIAVIELQAFEWGTAADSVNLGSWSKADGLAVNWDVPDSAARVSKVDAFTVKQNAVGERQAGMKELQAEKDKSEQRNQSGLPTGKRQHKPFTLTRPLEKGSVWVRVASPWADCRRGARYPSLTLSDGSATYRLVGATVAGCGRSGSASAPTEEVAFYYNKISF